MKNNRKRKNESQDILGMIRARQEQGASNDSSKLRDFLNNLDKDTCEEDYTETPIYQMGFEDGETAGYEIASQKFQNELRSLRTMIDAMIDSK
jgi:flagellar biosynthesis/type III secretory pathway protein FliH